LVASFALWGCNGGGSSSSSCSGNNDCAAGQICATGVCQQLCAADTQCPSDQACIEQVCTECNGCRQIPAVVSIDGNGSPDGDSTHSGHHLTDRLVLHGSNLEGVTVELTGGPYAGAVLEVCSGGTADRLEVALPTDIVAGTYSLQVANQAGSCGADVTLIQGEDGAPGSYTIGTGLTDSDGTLSVTFGTTAGTVAAGDDSRFHAPVDAVAAMGTLDPSNPLNHDRFTAGEAVAAATRTLVYYDPSDNIISDWQMEVAGNWSDAPEPVTVPLPGYPGLLSPTYGGLTTYAGTAHASVESGTNCYNWAVSQQFPVDTSRAYEYSVYIRSEDTTLNNYLGFYAYDSVGTRIVAAWNNPYLKSSEGDANQWVRWSGYVLPSTVPDANADGLADTQVRSSNGQDWVWPASTATAVIRFGSCYGDGSGSSRTYFALPTVREVNLP
jgi:hypothetical protein